MNEAEICLKAALVGIGGTALLDLWALFLARVFAVPSMNWAMVGRWFGNMPRGQFMHASMSTARPIKGEEALGWTAHYLIGAAYGLLLLTFQGASWFAQPEVLPPLILAWAFLVFPFFVMMPGLGLGIAGSRTPKPPVTRFKSLMSHTVFGLGMYASGLLLARV